MEADPRVDIALVFFILTRGLDAVYLRSQHDVANQSLRNIDLMALAIASCQKRRARSVQRFGPLDFRRSPVLTSHIGMKKLHSDLGVGGQFSR